MVLEVIKKHGKRLNPRWDYESYRVDVMAARGDHLVDKHRSCAVNSFTSTGQPRGVPEGPQR
eukprot:6234369-Amphidinium_carterae.1